LGKKKDELISWQDVEEYKYEPQRSYSLFQLKFRNNTMIRYWHNNSAFEDQYEEFLSYFQKQVVHYNEEGLNILHPIKRGKTIYETTGGIALGIGLGILMITFPILVATLPPRKIDWIYIFPAYSAGIFFISQVITHHRRKKQQPT